LRAPPKTGGINFPTLSDTEDDGVPKASPDTTADEGSSGTAAGTTATGSGGLTLTAGTASAGSTAGTKENYPIGFTEPQEVNVIAKQNMLIQRNRSEDMPPFIIGKGDYKGNWTALVYFMLAFARRFNNRPVDESWYGSEAVTIQSVIRLIWAITRASDDTASNAVELARIEVVPALPLEEVFIIGSHNTWAFQGTKWPNGEYGVRVYARDSGFRNVVIKTQHNHKVNAANYTLPGRGNTRFKYTSFRAHYMGCIFYGDLS
jgi:hypothetical protein